MSVIDSTPNTESEIYLTPIQVIRSTMDKQDPSEMELHEVASILDLDVYTLTFIREYDLKASEILVYPRPVLVNYLVKRREATLAETRRCEILMALQLLGGEIEAEANYLTVTISDQSTKLALTENEQDLLIDNFIYTLLTEVEFN